MVYFVWAVFGGFLLHILLCNYLTVLLRPRLEKPVNFATDLIQRNIIPYSYEGWSFLKYHFSRPQYFDPEYQELSQKLLIPNNTKLLLPHLLIFFICLLLFVRDLQVATFDTVEDFWALMNYISEANNIPVGTDYSLFKVGKTLHLLLRNA